MPSHYSPRSLLIHRVNALEGLLPGVRDAEPDAIHQARVVTRRVRELLPLLTYLGGESDRLLEQVKDVGRCLGRVRELDVMQEQLDKTQQRWPALAAVVANVSERVARKQAKARRKMIRRLEDVDVTSVLRKTAAAAARKLSWRASLSWQSEWRRRLRDRLAGHGEQLQQRVESAGGVYFADRSHGMRIQTKKLRYAVEAAEESGVWQPPRLLKDLRRIQSVLGEAHDVQRLLDEAGVLVAPNPEAEGRVALLEQLWRAQLLDFHREYLLQRDRLRLICRVCLAQAAPRHVAVPFRARLTA